MSFSSSIINVSCLLIIAHFEEKSTVICGQLKKDYIYGIIMVTVEKHINMEGKNE